jgi:hypothetical protein
MVQVSVAEPEPHFPGPGSSPVLRVVHGSGKCCGAGAAFSRSRIVASSTRSAWFRGVLWSRSRIFLARGPAPNQNSPA